MPKKATYLCSICNLRWKQNQNSIECSGCKNWVHAPPMKNCSLLDYETFISLTNSDNTIEWFCSNCDANLLPFSKLNDTEIFLELNNELDTASPELILIPDESFNDFIHSCEKLNFNSILNSDNDNNDLFNLIDSKYYHIHQFNKIKPDKSSSIGILHTNLASIYLHHDDLLLTLSKLKFDFHIIGITEHKIKDEIPTANIDIPGYHEFIFNPIETSHGGTGFYLSKSLIYNKRNDLTLITPGPGNFESIFLEIILPGRKNLIVGCIYRHPTSKISIDQFTNEHLEPVLQRIANENKTCALMGDFNIDLLKVETVTNVSNFFNYLSSNFFAPYILQPSRSISKSLIDNIFLNTIGYNSFSGNLTIQLSDHLFQFIILEGFFKDLIPRKIKVKERNFKNFNENEFSECIRNIDWDEILLLNNNDPNLSLEKLYNTVNFILDEMAPYRTLSKKEYKLKSKPWITKEIQFLMWERDNIFHQYCKEKDEQKRQIIYYKFKVKRNNLTSIKRNSKIEHYKNYFSLNSKKSAAIWKGIRSLVKIKQTSQRDILILDDKGSLITHPNLIVDHFNKYFVNVGPTIDNKIPLSKHNFTEYLQNVTINHSFFLKPVIPEDIQDIISSLDLNKSLGPNSLPIYIMKISNDFFSHYLSKIINISFTTGVFPQLCKTAKVIPIFKKDDPLNVKNYRPISLLPVFNKIFEKAIYTRMYQYLEANNLIFKRQFGFRANHSTNHALISMTEDIKSHLDSNEFVTGIFIDLEKAFDTVNHEILSNKLSYYGFRGKTNDLIKSFLVNRSQYVSINGTDSQLLNINCGVPQGSTLGPLLFLLYINDLRFSLTHSDASHFADGTCITYANKTLKTLESNINYDLKSLTEWLRANRLSLNVVKTKLLLFCSKSNKHIEDNISIKLQGIKLIPTDHVKYLGLYIDKNLSWNYHIKQLSLKLSRANGIISKLRHYAPTETILSVYYAIFYSHLSYGCSVWSLTTNYNLDKINILQNKCIRIINFAPFNSHTIKLFANNKLLKLEDIITSTLLKLVFEFKNITLPLELMSLFQHAKDIHNYGTRRALNDALFVPRIVSTNHGIRSLKYSAPLIWNEFSRSYPDICHFKHSRGLLSFLKNHFISMYNNI